MRNTAIALVLALAACSTPTRPVNQPQLTPVVVSTPLAIPSPTAEWIDAGNNGVAGVQFQPVKSDGLKAQFWMRVVFSQPAVTGDRIQVIFQDADCQKGTYYSRYLARFDSNQQLLSQGTPSDENTAIAVQPDSPAETAFKLSCAMRK